MNKKIKKETANYPKQLQLEEYFKCPIWWADEPKFVKKLNKASDKYIKDSQKRLKTDIDKRNKKFGDKGDMGVLSAEETLSMWIQRQTYDEPKTKNRYFYNLRN